MKRELMVAVVATTMVASVAACSSGNKPSAPATSSSATSSSATSSAATSSAAAGPASPTAPGAPAPTAPNGQKPAKITIGDQPLDVTDPVDCSTKDGKFSIAIGQLFTGVIIGMEQDASVVHLIGFGTVDNLSYNFGQGAPGEKANATKNGNSYHITGIASGIDDGGKTKAQKPFTIDVTCP